jgi:trk system potassium uptake protein TrkA
VVAELHAPLALIGKTLLEADVRKVFGVNIVAMKGADAQEYEFVSPQYRFQTGDVLLLTGSEDRVAQFSGIRSSIRKRQLKSLLDSLAS